jgi:hypothetical protein
LTRPEGILLGGIVALLMLITRPQGNLQRVIIWGIGAAVGFAVAMSPYLWLNLQLTGGLLPNTANAKFVQFASHRTLSYAYRIYALALNILNGGQLLLLPGVVFYIIRMIQQEKWRNTLYYLLPLWWSLALILLYAERLPFWEQHGRYVIPALPALIVMGVVGMVWLLRRSQRAFLTRTAARVLALSTLMLFVIFALWGVQIYSVDVAIIDSEMVTGAKWIGDNLPQDELLAIHDIGAVGYFAPRPMVDVAGLISPEVIPLIGHPDAMWDYLERNGATYFFGFPDQIPGDNPNDPRLCFVYSTEAKITHDVGRPDNMTLYRIAWDATCEG